MTRRKMPFGGGIAGHFDPSESQWQRLQEQYGHELLPDARAKIKRAVARYLEEDGFERSSYEEGERAVNALAKNADALRRSLPRSPTDEFLLMAVPKYFDRQNLLGGQDKLESLRTLLLDLVVASERALCDLKNLRDSESGYKSSDGWADLVRGLFACLKEHGLPTERWQSGNKMTESFSPAVRLMEALQGLLPKERRRHSQSRVALTKALKDVLSGWDDYRDVLPENSTTT